MRNKFISTIVLFCFCINLTILIAGTDGQIRGKITNKKGEPMSYAQVFIEELGIGTVADMDGDYILINIPVGSYDVTVAMISYSIQIYKDIDVIMDNTVWLNCVMAVEAIGGEMIYVSGEKDLVDKGATSKKPTKKRTELKVN